MAMGWRALASRRQLALGHTLPNGQCFGWKRLSRDGAESFVGVLGRWPLELRERGDQVQFRVLEPGGASKAQEAQAGLEAYFQLQVDLEALYAQWGGACDKLRRVGACLPGMRILRQEPLECLISFLCSSNNNIARITGMLDKLRGRYGSVLPIGDAELREEVGESLFAFPSLEQLATATEADLREMGFGYRAKYLTQTVAKLSAKPGGVRWLEELRALDQSEESLDRVREALCELDGVGPKVADCVALFSLDRRGVVPVDTHVWQIACRDFDRSLLEAKSLTPKVYARVGQLFRARYGAYAGWAHSLLFAAELAQFRDKLPNDLLEDISRFAAEEKERKAGERAAKRRRKEERAQVKREHDSVAAAAAAEAGLALEPELPPRKERKAPSARIKMEPPSADTVAAAAAAVATEKEDPTPRVRSTRRRGKKSC